MTALILISTTLALVLTTASLAKGPSINLRISNQIVMLRTCQTHLGENLAVANPSPWEIGHHNTSWKNAYLNKWIVRRKACVARLTEQKRQWNWQAFPQWIIDLARCETSINWYAEGSSSHGTFYSAFNIGRSRYDAAAHHMGVRGWNEGPGVPSPWEQAMAVIGYVRIIGDGFTGRCHGIARSTW